MSAYIDIVNEFNTISGFEILLPESETVLKQLQPYASKIKERIGDLKKYQQLLLQGVIDEHLAVELCLFVMHVNQVSLGIRNISVLGNY